jgi:hypothetical protein
MGGACSTHWEITNTYKTVIGKPVGKRSLARPRHRLKSNVRINLRAVAWEVLGWIHLAHDRDQWSAVANTVMNLRVP